MKAGESRGQTPTREELAKLALYKPGPAFPVAQGGRLIHDHEEQWLAFGRGPRSHAVRDGDQDESGQDDWNGREDCDLLLTDASETLQSRLARQSGYDGHAESFGHWPSSAEKARHEVLR